MKLKSQKKTDSVCETNKIKYLLTINVGKFINFFNWVNHFFTLDTVLCSIRLFFTILGH